MAREGFRKKAALEAQSPRLFADRLTPLVSKQQKKVEKFHDRIVAELQTNTAQTGWQRLHDEQGLDVSIRAFRRYVTAKTPGEDPPTPEPQPPR